jgi:hypothetical protein
VKIFGVDFTSRPRPAPSAKKIWCASGKLKAHRLFIDELFPLPSLGAMANLLGRVGPWVMGIDFPFGQPHELVASLKWGTSWDEYTQRIASMTSEAFAHDLKAFRSQRPKGKKHLYRSTDRLAAACSPMMLYGVPVGRMFFRGAPLLRASEATILPMRRRPNETRVVVEAYPKLVATACGVRASYKSDRASRSFPY